MLYHMDYFNSYLFICSKHKNINKILSKKVYLAMLTQETVKKPYGYQVNCHLKFKFTFED